VELLHAEEVMSGVTEFIEELGESEKYEEEETDCDIVALEHCEYVELGVMDGLGDKVIDTELLR